MGAVPVVPLVRSVSVCALSPCRPGRHPRAGGRRPAFGQCHDGPLPAGPAGQVWPSGAALCTAGWAGSPGRGRVPPGQGHCCSAPGLAQGKDLLSCRQAQRALQHFTPLSKPCVGVQHPWKKKCSYRPVGLLEMFRANFLERRCYHALGVNFKS